MNQAGVNVSEDIEAELALLRRRLARSEAARTAAEALLEEKSRVLAQANEELSAHKEMLSTELNRRTRQLLDAQRVASFGTMIWDVEAGRGELSPHAQAMLGLAGSLEIKSIHQLLRRVVVDDREKLLIWSRSIKQGAQTPHSNETALACRRRSQQAANRCPAHEECSVCPDHTKYELGIELRIMGNGPSMPNRVLRTMAQSEFDNSLGRTLIFLTFQDVTREVETANEAAVLRQRDQCRLEELEALADELRRAREVTEKVNAAKTRFLAMISHDIRTPLNGVIGILTLFDDGGLSEAQREALQLVRESSDQLRVLLDDIIDLERADSGQMKLSPAPMNTTRFLAVTLGFWSRAARNKGLAFELERMAFGWPNFSPEWIQADRYRLRQVVDNLLSNALKYTQRGFIKVKVGLTGPERLRFEVIDSGHGIPEEKRTELFEDFSQLEVEGSSPGGAGLGLAICRRIVTLMNGKIGVEAGPDGIGSRFWVELPWHAAAENTVSQLDEPMILCRPNGERPRILVAEDVETNRIVARGLLARLGCDVEVVSDGAQAVEAIQQSCFDLILMDMAMPVMDGPEATRQIRALPGETGQIPILALTAYSRPEELAPMLKAGAMGSINKPIVIEELYRTIKAVCCSAHDGLDS